MSDINNPIINILVVFFILFIFFIIFIFTYKNYYKRKYQEILKLVIQSLGDDLFSCLVPKEANTLNTLLYNYLKSCDEDDYKKMLVYFIEKTRKYFSYNLTTPSFIMKVLMLELMSEQLNLKYSNGFVFDKKNI